LSHDKSDQVKDPLSDGHATKSTKPKSKLILNRVVEVKFLFRPNDNFKAKWDLIVIISAVFNCFAIPFKVAFEPEIMEGTFFTVFNFIIDTVFLVDIIITFRTCFIDDYGNEINKLCGSNSIASHYLKG